LQPGMYVDINKSKNVQFVEVGLRRMRGNGQRSPRTEYGELF